MTNWLPDLSSGTGPLYVRLAERIEQDIASGALPPGSKLPPQRDLAYDIGVTIGTVGRAYALVRERGLVSGEVGRGTFVLGMEAANDPKPHASMATIGGTRPAVSSPDVLMMDSTSAPNIGQADIVARIMSQIVHERAAEVIDYTRSWPDYWREAGSRWLTSGDWKPDPKTVVPTLGVHAAVMAILSAVTMPGDKIVFEELTYSSISRSANMIGRRSIIARSDDQGIDPDDFDRLCAQQHPRLAFLMPSMQNPTLSIMSVERRKAVAEVARKHNVWLIEDAIYGVMVEDRLPALVSFAPERTFHVGGLSKAVAAGIRGGWVASPAHLAQRVQTAHKMVTGGLPFVLAELAAQFVLTGAADQIQASVRDEIGAREAVARQVFTGMEFTSHRNVPFLWMKLPEPWLSTTFKNAAATEGVAIDDEDEYKPGRTEQTYHRIRVGFSAVAARADAERGFATIRRLLDNASAGYDSYG